MRDEIDRELSPLIGRVWRRTERALDVLWLHFGDVVDDVVEDANASRAAAEAAGAMLQIACTWRPTDGVRILAGSGDLFTPADPDDDVETFDWEPQGSSWLDVRLAELAEAFGAERPVVEAVNADAFGGVRLTFGSVPVLGARLVLELFPSSTPTGHVSTEFWRLARSGTDDADFVVGTFGCERERSVQGE